MDNSTHPGRYVRENIIPSGMTVKAAAERLGIGRSALSNFLNGKSSLSSKLAARLAKTFDVDQKQLLQLQADYERQQRLSVNKEITVRAFVPDFLTIKARQIEDWVNSQLDARSRFPVLLRKLVHSTGYELQQVDFPGYDNSQRKGSDGFVAAGAATPWIPEGKSYWEFGTDKKAGSKAESDYIARIASIGSSERSNSTFIFVTPRHWHGKNDWVKQKNEDGNWKSVRAFDASDLEQWLEQSVPAQIWLAEQLESTDSGYETLEQAWSRWANASEPRLTPELFAPSIEAHKDNFRDWLSQPSNKPFVVAADSQDESLAFLACMFNNTEVHQFKDLTAVFKSPAELKKLVASSIKFIPIITSEDVERELLDAHQRLHYIVLRPRNAVDIKADIQLDLLSYSTFEKALISMGVKEGEVKRLASESGRSRTILRRRLSQNAAVRKPVWANDDGDVKALIPLTLIGTWYAESEADREIISKVATQKYESIENDIARLLQFDDSPVWSAGRYRGVTSKIDALFAIERMITWEDLDRFFVAVEYVLSEIDPALELPEKDRWAAALYNKTRSHSSALRKGISETLVILSVHGNHLFQKRIGLDAEGRVESLIGKLLTHLKLEKLLSHNNDLPYYAEAAPDVFLKIIEADLQQKDPLVFKLLKPVNGSLIGASPARTGLLWALECLAWKPQNLVRVSKILARLSTFKIDDNWVNKPDESLKAIFRSWMPQTAASVEQRYKALNILAKQFPNLVWELCIDQIKPGSRVGHYSYRPKWREDALEAGQVVTEKEMQIFNRKALDLIIAWPTHNDITLCTLVESLQGLPEQDQAKIWELIEEWSKFANDMAKAKLRECIRKFAFTRRSHRRNLENNTLDRARAIYDILQPLDTIISNAWLFLENWVEESAHEIEEDDFDFSKRDKRINNLRQDAMFKIYTEHGLDGILQLVSISNAGGIIGHYASACLNDINQRGSFINKCLSVDGELSSKYEWCIQGFLQAVDEVSLHELLNEVSNELPEEKKKILFKCAPFNSSTWQLLEKYGDDFRKGYWNIALPSWRSYALSELTEMVNCLLEAKRPRAAFYAVRRDFNNLETSLLKRLLYEVVTVNVEPYDHYKLESYYISKALDSLDGRVSVTREEMAQLEFLYIDALNQTKHGIPNLEEQIKDTPSLFIQAIALVYKRSDEGEDPSDWGIENPDQRNAVALSAHRLLDNITKIPGTDNTGSIDSDTLAEWILEVRRKCEEHGRRQIGDQCIGQLLANSPEGKSGIWPCEEVCDVMETISSQDIAKGFIIKVLNSRGAVWRSQGGEQERQISKKYRGWAERLNFEYPYVGSILEDIARTYDREASWYDSEEIITDRLNN
ncbi:HigA family addiction module antitoxin [Shouchella clausii]|uniref:HigA family addiction module antitoxin n=1 Tax=Shouchella clausii TaxID=79880 RepID=UPI0015CD48E7|nr:HigA family addiction module antitoxin [Shouchella clausii]